MFNLNSYRTILLILAVGILLVGAYDALSSMNQRNVVENFKTWKFVRKGSDIPIINLVLKMLLPALLSALTYVLAEVMSVIEGLQFEINDLKRELKRTPPGRS